ncbi:LADA_0G09758g1_1 [Lachancea dasiensis]|uniref:LADA_0G09758g1_1 n=1 Tax=Lachancea dasiensis TaxID=1072105 RepID=A0A1G4JUN6_9SACH|nr:LADA_0G09758g1_1 [Lachancea dasiensis]
MDKRELPSGISTLKCLEDATGAFSGYLLSYIETLNKYISHQRRVSTLRFERATLIKYVKKLRFFNEQLTRMKLVESVRWKEEPLTSVVSLIASFFIRCLEVIDLLNYYLTQALKNETISKTLNYDLVVSLECVAAVELTYRHFVKFTQWMLESLDLQDPTLTVEVLQFARKCAQEDGLDVEETEDILLQEVGIVGNAKEYEDLLVEWCKVLLDQKSALSEAFEMELIRWAEVFEARK